MEYNGKKYLKCTYNNYETVRNCGWIKTAPMTIGKIYEILGETTTWNDDPAYTITPDYTDAWTKSPSSYYKHLFAEPTEDEVKAFLRELKINYILND